jgi:cadmium resistance protein CadD (predicted permease)
LASVAGVTIANGADNISVYTPMYRTIGLSNSLIAMAMFAVGVALWRLTASWLGCHSASVVVDRHRVKIIGGLGSLRRQHSYTGYVAEALR